ncbi:hypothetical protein I3843_03G215700 [Carya illinoinensis]|uniref:Serine-rich protein n=1 Tax=Carya illinoinensis TaxID=32201 RepID=A0A8T1R878_CARIL|nr:hypothetical protein I3760_03G223300 [Carya illinoinensis]KAG6662292.1 hypothetical protein CIPAW_03G232800 [Carya illinoinensis]KAG6723698.1 hypothetical protein I3842_03G221100 [Carya illinoinensis]KAG7988979.1 hypothetical protein I3843_03G215700 [Carya illinoinensis]
MASQGSLSTNVSKTPKSGRSGGEGAVDVASTSSPKGGQCLCSPTTHQGSFRCRFHRSSAKMMKRSISMPADTSAAAALSPNSVGST